MSCLPCFKKKSESPPEELPVAQPKAVATTPPNPAEPFHKGDNANTVDSNAKTFTFRELASATKNFKQECLIGEGGFGRVFKGTLQGGEVVAVKQLDRSGTQGNQEFLVEVSKLTILKHPNLVNLIGYCADGDQRILVFEYMPMGCLEDHLLEVKEDKKPLDWFSRMKIASGAANGLEYLHEKANPPIIYRDFRSSNILLDKDFNPRLSDYGLAKLAGGGSKTNMSPVMVGHDGYCAPEFERSGELTLKSDVYSFGVVLLELITGRRAVDTTRPADEQNLVAWAQPYFKDPKRFPELADPLLGKKFPVRSLNQAVGVAAMCLQDEPSVRPLIGDVVAALSFLTVPSPNDPMPSSPPDPTPASNAEKSNSDNEDQKSSENNDQRDSDDEEQDDSDEDAGSESDQQNDEKVRDKKRSQKVRDSQDDDRASSDYGYGSASGSSEYEDSADEQGEKTTKSEKMGSRSTRKSKVKSRTRSINSSSNS